MTPNMPFEAMFKTKAVFFSKASDVSHRKVFIINLRIFFKGV